MNLLRTLAFTCIAILLFTARSASAQLSVYATPMFTGFGFTNGDGDNTNLYFGSNSGGIGGGVFYNFHHDSRLFLGVDARASGSFGTHGGEAFSANFRIGMIPYKVRLRPYFDTGLGAVTAP